MDDLTPVQVEILQALQEPNSRLRWHANGHHDQSLAGRGLVMGTGGAFAGRYFRGGPIASYTVRQIVKRRLVVPIDRANGKPFRDGGPPYRDYTITNDGRAAARGTT